MTNIDFLANAFVGTDHAETPWVASFPGDPASAPHQVWFGAPALPMPRTLRDDHNNYVCISTFLRGDDKRFRRRKDHWAALWLVMLDDVGTKIDKKRILLKPSCLVETSPGNCQAWYFLKSPERDRNKAETLISGLLDAGVSDPGAGNLTRYGRLPVGINGKAKYAQGGRPFTQRVKSWEPARRYSAAEIADAYGINLAAATHPQRTNRARKAGDAKAEADGYLRILEGAGLYIEAIRSMPTAHRIICPWFASHTDGDKTGAAYWEPSESNNDHAGFKCHHASCRHRTIADLDHFVSALLRNGDDQ